MEPAACPELRYRLILGKFQITKVLKGLTGFRVTLDLGNSVTMTVDAPFNADVRLGDILTIYTEVLSNAHADAASIQQPD